MIGTVPTQVGLLTALAFLSLQNNSLSGDLQFTSNLQRLTALLANTNSFDTLPPRETIERATELLLSVNEMTGELPRDLQAPNLETFTVERNMITGEIPPSFMSLTDCRFFGNFVLQCLNESAPAVGMCTTGGCKDSSVASTLPLIVEFTTAVNSDDSRPTISRTNDTTAAREMNSPEEKTSNTILFVITAAVIVVCLLFIALAYKKLRNNSKNAKSSELGISMKASISEGSNAAIYNPITSVQEVSPVYGESSFGTLQ